MLLNLHVKNLAIIDEIDIDFSENLNILTGETGAGKSIIVGSINIALGAKVSSEIIRKGSEYALVELIFQLEDKKNLKKFQELDLPIEDDGQVVISRKISNGRSINKINGVNAAISTLKQVASLCIDIHGQHENQSLLYKSRHLDIIDEYTKEQSQPIKEELSTSYREYRRLKHELESDDLSEEERNREISFLEYAKQDIEEANIKENEEEQLMQDYKKYMNASAIAEALSSVYHLTEQSCDDFGRVIHQMNSVLEYDEKMNGLLSQITDIEALINDFNHDISSYMSDFSFDEEQKKEMEERLDIIHRCKSKYGQTYSEINQYLQQCIEKLDKYAEYEVYKENLRQKIKKEEDKVDGLSKELSHIRKNGAGLLKKKIEEALVDLNFLESKFDIDFSVHESYTENGLDDVEFLISTNPGEECKSLSKIASGGELSRIMLAIKSVFAEKDEIETLIFDEIDAGISGRTAQKVSEKLAYISKSHQVICITHLAQIAAMADAHYLIEKATENKKTNTKIRLLSDEDSVDELARIIGGAKITDAVIASAKEMKELAEKSKFSKK